MPLVALFPLLLSLCLVLIAAPLQAQDSYSYTTTDVENDRKALQAKVENLGAGYRGSLGTAYRLGMVLALYRGNYTKKRLLDPAPQGKTGGKAGGKAEPSLEINVDSNRVLKDLFTVVEQRDRNGDGAPDWNAYKLKPFSRKLLVLADADGDTFITEEEADELLSKRLNDLFTFYGY